MSEQNPSPVLGTAETKAAGFLPAGPVMNKSDVGAFLGERLQKTGLALVGQVELPAVTWEPELFGGHVCMDTQRFSCPVPALPVRVKFSVKS